jgi:hypothetical protein
MSENLGDTSESSYEDSQTSDSEATDSSQDTGDTGSESEADESPVPYERFKESREQLSDSRDQLAQMHQQMSALQSQHQETAQWNRWAWEKMQAQEGQQKEGDDDPYSDPMENRVKQLEHKLTQQTQFYDHRYQEMQVAQAEREILGEIESARREFPEMRDSDVVNALMQSPNASVKALAKRSHESELQRFNTKLKRQGYKPKPKALQQGRGKAAIKQDFGDDLEAAEAAAIAALSD